MMTVKVCTLNDEKNNNKNLRGLSSLEGLVYYILPRQA